MFAHDDLYAIHYLDVKALQTEPPPDSDRVLEMEPRGELMVHITFSTRGAAGWARRHGRSSIDQCRAETVAVGSAPAQFQRAPRTYVPALRRRGERGLRTHLGRT